MRPGLTAILPCLSYNIKKKKEQKRKRITFKFDFIDERNTKWIDTEHRNCQPLANSLSLLTLKFDDSYGNDMFKPTCSTKSMLWCIIKKFPKNLQILSKWLLKFQREGNAVHEFKNNIPFNIRLSGSSIE